MTGKYPHACRKFPASIHARACQGAAKSYPDRRKRSQWQQMSLMIHDYYVLQVRLDMHQAGKAVALTERADCSLID